MEEATSSKPFFDGLTSSILLNVGVTRYLALRHGEGELAVTLVGHVNGFALCVGNRQLIELIACIRGDGYGNCISRPFSLCSCPETLPFDAVDAETVLDVLEEW